MSGRTLGNSLARSSSFLRSRLSSTNSSASLAPGPAASFAKRATLDGHAKVESPGGLKRAVSQMAIGFSSLSRSPTPPPAPCGRVFWMEGWNEWVGVELWMCGG